MKDILIKNRETLNYNNKKNSKMKNSKKLINNKRQSEEENDNNEMEEDSNNESQKINKKNYQYISPNNIVISPTSNNEIKYNIKYKRDNSKEDEDQSQRIDRLINSIKTNQNTIKKSYGMIDVQLNPSNISNKENKNKKNKKEKDYLRNEENKNLYYNTTDGNRINSIEMNKYTLMYFCYLINHYMKRKVKIYKYLLKNNIDTISQIYSEESISYFYDSEKYFNRNNQKNNKIEKTNKAANNKKSSKINKKFNTNKKNYNKSIKTIKTSK